MKKYLASLFVFVPHKKSHPLQLYLSVVHGSIIVLLEQKNDL
jgi:hypothetical protein